VQRKSVYTHFDVCFESIFGSANTSGIALALKTGVPSYQVQDEEGRIHLLIDLPIEDGEHRWCLWRQITQTLIPDRFLTGRWWMGREAGLMEYWSVGLVVDGSTTPSISTLPHSLPKLGFRIEAF
jgi:hypothetical protein